MKKSTNKKALELKWKNWGLGEETKKIIIGEDKIKSKRKYFFLVNLLKIPIKLRIPENWIKFPNCSAPKKNPSEYNTSPELTNKLVKLSREVGNLPVSNIYFAPHRW